LCSVTFSPRALSEEIFNIGAAAPPLFVSRWVKGDHIESFEPGKMYVVEFWAAWCGPCRESIPHLTEMAHDYKDKDIRFVGVDIFEDDTSGVQPFVDQMGDKMDYSVALDSVPDGKDSSDGKDAKNWIDAADEHGIPTSFIIKDGKVAWIGHPMDLNEPLDKILGGNWNLAEAAKARLVEKQKEKELEDVEDAIFKPFRAKDYKGTVTAIDEALKKYPDLANDLTATKFAAVANGGDVETGLKLGTELLETNKNNAQTLNGVYWDVIDPELGTIVDPRISQLALKGLTRAVELTKGESPEVLDSFAVAQFRVGKVDAAIAAEEKALRLAQANADSSADSIQTYKDRIESFRKGNLKGGGAK
jgi:thiol-disulfide isomerase/thioredoxin